MNLTKYQANGMTFSNLKLTGSSVNIERLNKFVSNLEIDPVIKNMSVDEIKKIIEKNSSEMNKAADKLDFYEAARLRDENIELQKILENKS